MLNRLDNFSVADYFARSDKYRGGSCLLVNSKLGYKRRNDLKCFNEAKVFEGSFIEISEYNSIFGSVYRIPNNDNVKDFLVKLESLLYKLKKETRNKKIYLAFDTNINVLHLNQSSLSMIEICECYGFEINFKEPTRTTTRSSTCIDNIFTNLDSGVIHKTKILDLGVSDHHALLIRITKDKAQATTKLPKNNKVIRKFNNDNLLKFKASLSNQKWVFDEQKNANENFDSFLMVFKNCFNESYVPVLKRIGSVGKVKKWVTQGIVVSAMRKRQLHAESKWNNDPQFLNYYKNYKKTFKKVVFRAKLISNDEFIKKSDNKSKATWVVIKNELGLKKNTSEMPIEVDNLLGNVHVEVGMIANDFNNFFVNVAKSTNLSTDVRNALKYIPLANENTFKFFQVSICELRKIVHGLKNKKSTGWDEIPMFLIKQVFELIRYPLCSIINQSLRQGLFPEKLKFSDIKPLYKKGCVNDPSSYRPLALIPNFSKIFEKVVEIQLSKFLESNAILNPSQYGFRKNYSTSKAIGDLVDSVSRALDGSERTVGVFCDLSKAFDCVNHDILLSKLNLLGIKDVELKWFVSYLKNRKQRIIINKNGQNYKSGWKEANYGVPQGSILGPCMFIIYVNDLCKATEMDIYQYADDTTLICTGRYAGVQEILTKELLALQDWFSVNGLSMNISKTGILEFKTSNVSSVANIQFNSQNLPFLDSVTFLGVKIDTKLNWRSHILNLSKKLSSIVYSIGALKYTTSFQTQLTVYHAYFASHLTYAIIAWGNSSQADSIFKIQKRAVRRLASVPPRTHCKQLFINLKILTLYSHYILELSCLAKSKMEIFMDRQPDHGHNTRNCNSIKPVQHRLKLFECSPQYMAPKIYNKLPLTIRQTPSLVKFKNLLCEWLVTRAYYSTKEFLEDTF